MLFAFSLVMYIVVFISLLISNIIAQKMVRQYRQNPQIENLSKHKKMISSLFVLIVLNFILLLIFSITSITYTSPENTSFYIGQVIKRFALLVISSQNLPITALTIGNLWYLKIQNCDKIE